MPKIIKKISLIYSILMAFALSSLPTLAVTIVPEKGKATGDYSLNDIILIGVNVSQWILGIVGSLSLLMFVYGGFTLILSGGNAEKVTQGKQIFINAIIGLVIVFTSYLIIQFFMTSLGYEGTWSTIG